MEEIITKQTVNEWIEMEGKTRGVSIKGDFEYIISKRGEKGLRKIEERMEELGYPLKYKEIQNMKFYPLGLEAIVFLVIKELFNFDDNEFRKMGEFNAKVSLVVRLFMRYLISLDLVAKKASYFWKKYYTNGDFEITEINKEKQYLRARLSNFRFHPIHCRAVEGYLMSLIKMVLNSPVFCQETKCPFLGDDYHEFLVKW